MSRPSTILALVALGALAGPLASQEQVLARRLSDSVAVRTGPDKVERVLYYFAPTAELGEGDELEQLGSAHSEVLLSAGGMLELHASAHLVVERLSPQGDLLDLRVLSRVTVQAGRRPLVVLLPGSSRCRLQDTQMELRVEPGMLRVRNTGGEPVTVIGRLSLDRDQDAGAGGDSELHLERGQEVLLPLFELVPPATGAVRDAWGQVAVRHDGRWVVRQDGGELVAQRAVGPAGEVRGASPEALLLVGGVAVSLPDDGPVLRLTNLRHPVRMGERPAIDPATGYPPGMAPGEVSPRSVEQMLQLGFTIEQLRATGYDIPEPAGEPPGGDAEGGEDTTEDDPS